MPYVDPDRRNQNNRQKQHHRRWLLKTKYGITLEQYEALRIGQQGRCAICGEGPARRRLDVDHSHETGDVRALLCSRCNMLIGKAGENGHLLRAAADYVERFGREVMPSARGIR